MLRENELLNLYKRIFEYPEISYPLKFNTTYTGEDAQSSYRKTSKKHRKHPKNIDDEIKDFINRNPNVLDDYIKEYIKNHLRIDFYVNRNYNSDNDTTIGIVLKNDKDDIISSSQYGINIPRFNSTINYNV